MKLKTLAILATLSVSAHGAQWVPLNVPEVTDAKFFYDRDTLAGKNTAAGGGVDVRILAVLNTPDQFGTVEIVQRKAFYCEPAKTGNTHVNMVIKTWRYGAPNQQQELEVTGSERSFINSATNPVDRAAVGALCSSVTGQLNGSLR